METRYWKLAGWLSKSLETGLGGVEAPQARGHDCGLRALRGLRSASLRGMEELVGNVLSLDTTIRARCKPDVIVAELERRCAFDGATLPPRAEHLPGPVSCIMLETGWLAGRPVSYPTLETGWLGLEVSF